MTSEAQHRRGLQGTEQTVSPKRASRSTGTVACIAAVVAINLLVLLPACFVRDDGPRRRVTIREAERAIGSAETVRVRGFLVHRRAFGAHLCEAELLSYPPQCGGASIVVRGRRLPLLESFSESRWTEDVVVTGNSKTGRSKWSSDEP